MFSAVEENLVAFEEKFLGYLEDIDIEIEKELSTNIPVFCAVSRCCLICLLPIFTTLSDDEASPQ